MSYGSFSYWSGGSWSGRSWSRSRSSYSRRNSFRRSWSWNCWHKPSNSNPDAKDDVATVMEDDGRSKVFNVLSNDTDANHDTLKVSSFNGGNKTFGTWFTGTNGGEFCLLKDGSVDFRQGSGEFDYLGEGEEAYTSFTYVVSDGKGGFDTATATIKVVGKNDAPVAVDDHFGTVSEDAGNISVFGTGNRIIERNDFDADGDELTIAFVNGDNPFIDDGGVRFGEAFEGSNGGMFTVFGPGGFVDFNATFDGNGDFDYLKEGETTTTSFEYTITDGNGGFDTAKVTVTIEGKNDGPVATNDTGSTDAETPVTIDVLANDTDIDGDALSIEAFSDPAGGAVEIVDGKLVYTPDAGFSGTDVFEYTVTDEFGATSTAEVSVDVTAKDPAPSGPKNFFKIGDTVWLDADGDGRLDGSEEGLGGVVVTLTGAGNDGQFGTADDYTATYTTGDLLVTNDGKEVDLGPGGYRFDNLAPGDYQLKFDLPDGYDFTIQDAPGTKEFNDSDVDPETGLITGLTLVDGDTTPKILTADAGVIVKEISEPSGPQNFFKIGDTVWLDADGDGRLDNNEEGFSGVVVTLTGAGNDGQFGTADDYTATYTTGDLLVTDDGKVVDLGPGGYRFDNLTPGDYQLEFDLPEGYDFTIQDAPGTKEFNDSDVDPETGLITGLTLVEGDTTPKILTADAGVIKKPTGEIIGHDCIHEGESESYQVKLDSIVTEDTFVTINIDNGTAKQSDGVYQLEEIKNLSNPYTTNVELGEQGQLYSANLHDRNMAAHYWNGTHWFSGDLNELPIGADSLMDDFVVAGAQGDKLIVKVEAGSDTSESFDIEALKEIQLGKMFSKQMVTEDTETFSLNIEKIGDVEVSTGEKQISIKDEYANYSPISFDLNGNGIQTLSIEAGVTFDMLNTGDAVNTGWLSGEDGFLAVDNNGDGLISSRAELFGGLVGDGFAKLSTFDSNGDGLVNGRDAQFDELKLWQDANENGFTDKGELVSLESAGISDLNTAYTNVFSTDANGNIHGEVSTAVKNGGTIEMTDVYFQVAV